MILNVKNVPKKEMESSNHINAIILKRLFMKGRICKIDRVCFIKIHLKKEETLFGQQDLKLIRFNKTNTNKIPLNTSKTIIIQILTNKKAKRS